MADSNWVEVVAASATAISAVVIAWQAWQTRAAVKASNETVDASRAAVDVAQSALRESQLARLESGVPRVFVTTPSYVDPAKVQIPLEGQTKPPWQWEDVPHTRVFKLPRDRDRRLRVSHSVTVRNDGPGSVELKMSEWVRFSNDPSHNVFASGESREGKYTVSHTVGEWIALSETHARGDKAIANVLKIHYTGPKDADVTEVHTIEMIGSCLAADPDATGDWIVPEFPWDTSLEAGVLPAERKYWRSRSKQLEF